MKNKRALEHPQEVIRMLFIAIIIIFNIVIIYNLMQDIDVQATYRVNNLKYNAIAARILYSSDCYALEDTYTLDGKERHQVHAGVLDIGKLKQEGRLSKCITNAEYKVEIKDFDGNKLNKGGKTNKCDGWTKTAKMLTLIDDNGELKGGIAKIKVCV